MQDEWLTPKDISKLLKVSKPLPYQWVKRGLLPYHKLPSGVPGKDGDEGEGRVIRVRLSDLLEFINSCRIEMKGRVKDKESVAKKEKGQ